MNKVRYVYGLTSALLVGGAAVSLITGSPLGAQVAQNDDAVMDRVVPVAGAPASFADLTAQLQPAVVNIATRQRVEVANNPFAGTPFAELFNRRGGTPGWLAFPFMVAFEWLGPIVELVGYLFMAFAWAFGLVSWEAFAIFLFVAIGLGILLSFSGLLLEEMTFHLYPRMSQLALLAGVIVLENLGYRQIIRWWRLVGLWRCNGG